MTKHSFVISIEEHWKSLGAREEEQEPKLGFEQIKEDQRLGIEEYR
ncbi:hypothetical protein A2U01_0080222, partial [Trifolium medium]|nr:hypothetical protein [Trifolium medium]